VARSVPRVRGVVWPLCCARGSNHHSTFWHCCGSTNCELCEALRQGYECVSVWSLWASAIALAILFMPPGRLAANADAACDR
jgi:hypothetical protein